MQWAYKYAKLYIVVLFLAVATLPALAYEPATIAQLEQILAAAHGKPDKDLAKQLGELELTERLSTVRLDKLQASLPGIKSRQALLVLSDNSAFRSSRCGDPLTPRARSGHSDLSPQQGSQLHSRIAPPHETCQLPHHVSPAQYFSRRIIRPGDSDDSNRLTTTY
jgi:hypothetical protein